MIGYFPPPYKGESLYSIISRYANHYNLTKTQTLEELFDSKHLRISSLEYIDCMNILAKNITHFSEKYTLKYLLKYHSTACFYAPFIEGSDINYEENLIYFYKHRKYGGTIKPKQFLYYCSACLQEQFETYGEGFWQSMNQLPGVLVCTKHKRMLNTHNINLVREPLNRLEIPNYEMINTPEPAFDLNEKEQLLNITENIQYFFENEVGSFNQSILANKYQEYMKIFNMLTPISQGKSKLIKLINTKFSGNVLDLLHSNPNNLNWISQVFSKSNFNKIKPIRHVLLMMTLSNSVKNFIEGVPSFKPFGEGPWVCMNSLSQHYLEKVVNNVEITYKNNEGDFHGDFQCECGFVYRLKRNELDPLKVKNFNLRVISRGESWEREFEKLVNKGLKLKELALKTNLCKIVVGNLKREGVKRNLNNLKEREKKTIENRTQKNRIIWKNILQNNPKCSRTELINLNPNVYKYLLKYDNEWYQNNSPSSRVGTGKSNIDFYKEMDKFLLKEARILYNDWKNHENKAGKLIKRTYTGFSEKLKAGNYLVGRKELVPNTVSFILSVIETKEEFQKRKIQHLFTQHPKIARFSTSKIVKIAGMRFSNITEQAKTYLEELKRIHNEDNK